MFYCSEQAGYSELAIGGKKLFPFNIFFSNKEGGAAMIWNGYPRYLKKIVFG